MLTQFPWNYRLLTPLFVSSLPIPLYWGFRFITALATTGVLTGLYFLSRRLGVSAVLSGTIAGLYALHPQSHYQAAHCALVDMTTTLLLVLAIHAVVFKQERLLGTSLLLGVLNHESMVWFIPVPFIVALWEHNRGSAIVRSGILCLPALAAFGITRFLLPSFSDQVIVEKIMAKNLPYLIPPPRFIDSYIKYFYDNLHEAGGILKLLTSGDPAGGAALLIPLAAVGFYRSAARMRSLAVFLGLNISANLVIQARPELMYLHLPVIMLFVAVVFSEYSKVLKKFQTLVGCGCLAGMAFRSHSWILGVIIAVLIVLSRLYRPVERASMEPMEMQKPLDELPRNSVKIDTRTENSKKRKRR